MKKFLSLVLALVMTMSLVTVSAGAKDFTDNDAITYDEAVAVMSEIGVIDGYTTGDFKPTATLTRGAAAKIICNLILGPTTASALAATTAPFSDVAADSTFAGYIAYLAKEGIIGGYADGTFKPGNSLTGYAFLKMLLGALGYDADIEGYNGANYAVSVAKQAIEAGLTNGLVNDFDGRPAVTREEACLYAFNTLQAIMVEYDNRIVVGEGATAVAISGVRKDLSWNKGTKNDGNIEDDGYVQFAEQYFPKLEKEPDVDAFYRPATTWTYASEKVGTFVDWSEMVAEYTTAASGKEMYDAIGSTAFKYDFYAYVDGAEDDLYTEVSKNNKDDVSNTADGALTQIFVNSDSKYVVITVINTYLAEATGDYNAKKDSVNYKLYDKELRNGSYTFTTITDTVSGEDFAIEDVEKGDLALATYSYQTKAIESFDEVEVIEDVTISTYTTSKGVVTSVTVDGTKYNDSAKLAYDEEVLDKYVQGYLKDTKYNVYLDAYGYVIGVDVVDAKDNYVFITGADSASSNLATANWTANAIFLDGTCEVITVKNNAAIEDKALINEWFTYTVNSKGVYELEEIPSQLSADDDVAQWHTVQSTVSEINDTHIWLNGKDEHGHLVKVYGNDDTVYLVADMKKVTIGAKTYGVIAGVDDVVVGVDNVSIEVLKDSDVKADLGVDESVGGSRALFDDDGYIIAAVVVGESGSVSSGLAFGLKSGVTSESYADDEWTWTTDVVIDGVKVELTEHNDSKKSELSGMKKYSWFDVKYYGDGSVKEITEITEDTKTVKYADNFAKAVAKLVDNDLVVLSANDINTYSMSGKTLYDTQTATAQGIRVDADVDIVYIQTANNKETTSYETGSDTLKDLLDELNKTVKYDIDAVIEDGKITSVIIVDQTKDDDYTGANGGTGSSDITLISFNESTRKATMEYDNTVVTRAEDVYDFIKDVMTYYGYTWTKVEGSSGTYKAYVMIQGTKDAVSFDFTKV